MFSRGCLLVLLLFYHMDRGITINILVIYSGEYLVQWQVVSEMLHIRLRVEAVGRCATHFEALLTAVIADIRDAVLYSSPFQLGEHDKIFSFARPIGVDVMRRPVNQRGRSGNKMDRFSGVW